LLAAFCSLFFQKKNLLFKKYWTSFKISLVEIISQDLQKIKKVTLPLRISRQKIELILTGFAKLSKLNKNKMV